MSPDIRNLRGKGQRDTNAVLFNDSLSKTLPLLGRSAGLAASQILRAGTFIIAEPMRRNAQTKSRHAQTGLPPQCCIWTAQSPDDIETQWLCRASGLGVDFRISPARTKHWKNGLGAAALW
jgi:hypothetical protein